MGSFCLSVALLFSQVLCSFASYCVSFVKHNLQVKSSPLAVNCKTNLLFLHFGNKIQVVIVIVLAGHVYRN